MKSPLHRAQGPKPPLDATAPAPSSLSLLLSLETDPFQTSEGISLGTVGGVHQIYFLITLLKKKGCFQF